MGLNSFKGAGFDSIVFEFNVEAISNLRLHSRFEWFVVRR
jgi:hypothetical protein